MAKWKVCSLDVWGNNEDGYEVNDIWQVGVIELPDNIEDCTDQYILKTLQGEGFLAPHFPFELINIDGDDTILFIDSLDSYPIFQLIKDI